MKTSNAISRIKKGRRFVYTSADGMVADRKTLSYIESLAIPPAWDAVLIARSPNAKVLAMGQDAAGRAQSIYSPKFRARQEKLKFDRILRFALALPKLRAQLKRDLARRRLVKEKVVATIVTLIDTAYFRVGNEKYASENQSYGITTLRSKHTEVSGDTVTFEYIGKSGKQQFKEITNPQIARIVKRLDELPGYEVFRYQQENGAMHDISSADVNDYIKQYMGEEFSAKDFRTWGGTLLATAELLEIERSSHKYDRTQAVTKVVSNVAKKLGNTPAVARSSYIDPRVLSAYVDSTSINKVKNAMTRMKPKRYLGRDEQAVLRLLEMS